MDSVKPYLEPFFSLQYPVDTPAVTDSFPDSQYYNIGKNDIWLVITCIAVMAILRDALRLGVFEPFARWKLKRDLAARSLRDEKSRQKAANGHAANGNGHYTSTNASIAPMKLRKLNHSVMRFAEQGWSVVYYTLQWLFGLYVHRNLPTRVLDPIDLWVDYPHIPLAAPLKFYYLTQSAFYLHQILILNAEARRKDHVQMMTHHVITVILMGTSYLTSFTRVGCMIMVLMDFCDIFLPLAKMLKYIGYQMACDATFVVFLVSWFITRHVLFPFVIRSTIVHLPVYVPSEPQPTPDGGYYLSKPGHAMFCILLLALQVIQIIWFLMICRVAWRVINGSNASDVRSDDEDEESEEKEQ